MHHCHLQGFEPYVFVSKSLVPWYDERFTGYLEDKVVHIQTMVHMGFGFAVHSGAFVVHYPHPDSKDQALVKSTSLMHEVSHLTAHGNMKMSNRVRLCCEADITGASGLSGQSVSVL